MRLPLDAVRASEVTEEMLSHQVVENGIACIQVHPTFLYESLWNLGVLAVLLVITLKGLKKFKRRDFSVLSSSVRDRRFWIEGLRTDQLLLPVVNLPVSQLLSIVLAAVSWC